jgi:hypothetical protein
MDGLLQLKHVEALSQFRHKMGAGDQQTAPVAAADEAAKSDKPAEPPADVTEKE